MGNAPSTPLESCLTTLCASRADCVAFPSTPFYQLSWARAFNLDYPVLPAAVFRPLDANGVAGAVRCASAAGVAVQARSGGHSYGNYGLGGQDGALVIDLVNLQSFEIDNSTWLARVGSGFHLGDLDKKLHAEGGRAFSHGVCPGVGIGGHATIGGLGASSRMWGSALDHVVEVEVVTATGDIVTANETENEDLYFAIKGAAASFGIVTKFTLRTHPEPETVAQHTLTFSFGSHTSMAPVFASWQALATDPNLDRRFSTEFVAHPLGAVITATFYGSQEEFAATGIPGRLPVGGDVHAIANDWLGSLIQEAANEALYISDLPNAFASKSLAFKQQDILSRESIDDIFTWIDGVDKGTILWFVIFDSTGGAISDIPFEKTSYAHRDKIMFCQSYAVALGSVPKAMRDFVEGLHARIVGASPGANSTYAGYVDPRLQGDAEVAYWGAHVPRLREVKGRWDPGNLFRNPQSVRVG